MSQGFRVFRLEHGNVPRWIAVSAALLVVMTVVPAADAAAAPRPREVGEARSVYTGEFGVARPIGVAVTDDGHVLVAGVDDGTTVVEFTMSGRRVATSSVTVAIEPGSLSFDTNGRRVRAVAAGRELTLAKPSVRPGRQRGVAGAPVTGPAIATTFDAGDESTVRLSPSGEVTRSVDGRAVPVSLALPTGARFDAVAVDVARSDLYLLDDSNAMLYVFDASGTNTAIYDLGPLALGEVTAIAVGPSADATDAPGTQSLYVADSGTSNVLGRVVEVLLTPTVSAVAAAAPTIVGTLVRTTLTSAWVPASPDPSGIVYLPSSDRLVVVDSEVEEVTGAGWHGVNMWVTTRAGSVIEVGTTHPAFSKEPTGLGARTNTTPNVLYISDDSKQGIHIDLPGADGRFGTADDSVTFVATAQYGTTDVEDPEYDPVTGYLYFLDGVSAEVYVLDPVDSIFGNGNDAVSHFDIGVLGASDFEALGIDLARGTLLVGAKTKKRVFEITKTGTLVQTFDLSGVSGLKYISGLTLAPASNGSGQRNLYIVDRGVDNDAQPTENDGKMFEIALPTSDAPPTVAITAPTAGSVVAGSTVLSATASDDFGVVSVRFSVDGTTVGTDTVAADGWSSAWNSGTVSDGGHVLEVVATDTAGQTATATVSFSVRNTDSPPTVSLSSPASGAFLGGTVLVTATATDDVGVASVRFSVDGTAIGTDTNGADGWSVAWDTTSAGDGPKTLTALGTDTAGQTAASDRSVQVDNTPPAVTVTAPVSGATVSGAVSIAAGVVDAGGATSVVFRVDGATVGTDSNGADGWSVSWNTVAAGNGAHTVDAIATDSAGNIGTSAPTAVTVANAPGGSVEVFVASGADDVEEKASNGNITVTSTDLDMMTDRGLVQSAVGLRFASVPIPAGAVITRAYLQFQTDETSPADSLTLTVALEDSANAAPFTTAKRNVTGRAVRPGAVVWTPGAWPVKNERGASQATPDLGALVQGVIGKAGWSQGNSMVFIVTGSGSGTRVASAVEGGNPPSLFIEYTLP